MKIAVYMNNDGEWMFLEIMEFHSEMWCNNIGQFLIKKLFRLISVTTQ